MVAINKIEEKKDNKKEDKSKKNLKIIRWIIGIITFIIVGIIVIYLFPVIINISTTEGQLAFKEKVIDSNIWGILILFALQVAQMVLIVLPGEPMEILAGMCYGVVGGTIYIFVSVFIISIVIFYLSRKFGTKFVKLFFNEEKINKIENSKLFKNTKLVEYIMLILFLIPGTPKDLLTYIGGLLPVNPVKFILIATFARFPSVISSTIAGANISQGNWLMSVLAYVITFFAIGVFLFIVNIFDKNKITKKAIDEIK